MSYMALYRKWRPTTFEDVKGQDHIVQTLKNQITSGRIGHAYLFCGTRGTGKTSIAKIFARAVNCEHPVDGSPYSATDAANVQRFQKKLESLGVNATVRRRLGSEISAACGQLRRDEMNGKA